MTFGIWQGEQNPYPLEHVNVMVMDLVRQARDRYRFIIHLARNAQSMSQRLNRDECHQ